ncbi:hypothetical protein BOTU111921_03835 [Bordetella tumbae]
MTDVADPNGIPPANFLFQIIRNDLARRNASPEPPYHRLPVRPCFTGKLQGNPP